MSGRSDHDVPWDDDFWEVSHAAARLTQYACEVAVRCLDDGMLRLQFTQEMAYVGKGIVEDVRTGRKTPEQGLVQIGKEHAELADQVFQYSKLVAGLAAGVIQVAGGVAVCKLTAGVACALGGHSYSMGSMQFMKMAKIFIRGEPIRSVHLERVIRK